VSECQLPYKAWTHADIEGPALKFQEGGRKAHVFAFVSAICKIVSDIVSVLRRPGASRWGRGQLTRPSALRTSLNMLRRIASEHEAQAGLFADTMPQGVTPPRAN